MSVYVDTARIPFTNPLTGVRMVMCHMYADSESELMLMAANLGLREEWYQVTGRSLPHFDIAASKRQAALRCGAVEDNNSEVFLRLSRAWHAGGWPWACTQVLEAS